MCLSGRFTALRQFTWLRHVATLEHSITPLEASAGMCIAHLRYRPEPRSHARFLHSSSSANAHSQLAWQDCGIAECKPSSPSAR